MSVFFLFLFLFFKSNVVFSLYSRRACLWVGRLVSVCFYGEIMVNVCMYVYPALFIFVSL